MATPDITSGVVTFNMPFMEVSNVFIGVGKSVLFVFVYDSLFDKKYL
tara:strand:+ start:77730 stop:77870 length:141 start_codon:yes stop_codon:yes gene_type:complete